jgi:regulation of enolase protein 1 (concanavalin A-like superfamily)
MALMKARARPASPSILLASLVLAPAILLADPAEVRFRPSAEIVEVHDFLEVEVEVDRPDAANPFTDAAIEGSFAPEGGDALRAEGFCDSPDGRTFRIRFMPARAGAHRYSVKYRQGGFERSHEGAFKAVDAGRRGLVRVDREHPWHFIWSGTGEHYFWNGTTTYWLLGWDDENIRRNIDRLHALGANRLRVVINGRVKDGRAWYENVFPTDRFRFILNPWVAARPDDVANPGFDVRRFNVSHWQKYDRLLRDARERDVVISVIFHVDGARPGVDPFGKAGMGGEDEQRYYRYAVARFAAFSNVLWDVTNEYHLFRNEAWTEKMGTLIKDFDPYDHLASVHGHGDFAFRTSPWADFAMYQEWDEGGSYRFLLKRRGDQAATGRPMPQVNEEYGYEDHYPAAWGGGRKAPSRSADNRRRLAWGMYMAGGYQTTGERADRGTGWGPDTGGGWINGRGDATMTMLEGYRRIMDFFTGIEWWRLEPDPGLVAPAPAAPAEPAWTHVAYTRDADGRAVFYVDGAEKASGTVSGDFASWESSFRLALANELTGDRPWRGELGQIAVYARALAAPEVAARHAVGRAEAARGAEVLYTFLDGSGETIRDVSGKAEPADLKIETPGAVRWTPGGGLTIQDNARIASPGATSARLIAALKESRTITVEAWIRPADLAQKGPARIVTLSKDPSSRNFTLGQIGPAYELRLRTTTTSPNGEPALRSSGDAPEGYVAALRAPENDLAVIYFAAGGETVLRRDLPGATARWYDPRTGAWSPAEVKAGVPIRAPGKDDWALLFERNPVVFRETFRGDLDPGWSWLRDDPAGRRLGPGGLDLSVEPGNMWGPPNNAKNVLVRPAPDDGGEGLDVRVAFRNRPTAQYEQVDLVWYFDDSNMVKLGQELVNGQLSIVMGREEGDRTRTVKIVPIAAARVQLRLLVKGSGIRGQFRALETDPWTEVGACDLPRGPGAPKISIQAYQGPKDAERWARITELQVRRGAGA